MGFRFRKSKNLGGGFRVNLSKSGVGGSWGTKGFRITKKAKGGLRTTFSIPGTGISYSSDSKGCTNGCMTLFVVYPLKLCFWMIYGTIWLCFILPIKLIIKLCKKLAHQEDTIVTQDSEEID